MRNKFLRLIFSRVFVFAVLILAQLVLITGVVLALAAKGTFVYSVLMFFSLLIILWLFSTDLNPSYKMAWTIMIMGFPLVGAFYFLFWQRVKISRGKRKLLRDIYEETAYLNLQTKSVLDRLEMREPKLARQGEYIQQMANAPVCTNTSCQYFSIGEAWYRSLLQELEKAEKFIFMEYFIVNEGQMWQQLFQILKEKAAQGVEVRLMYDDLGSTSGLTAKFMRETREAGLHVVAFNPFRPRLDGFVNSRDHRKICVIDGKVAYNGGTNIADEYINLTHPFGHWKDTAVLIKGDGVWSFTLMFLEMWRFATGLKEDYLQYHVDCSCAEDGFIQPYGANPLHNTQVVANAYLNMIHRAEKYLYIVTPYLILDNETVTALCLAAKSGVDVRIITPGIPDKKLVFWVTQSFYKTLIMAGVKIYQYTPGFIHAKMLVADDVVATVGSANMDYRSLYLHFECNTAFYYSSVVKQVKEDIWQTIGLSHEITLAELEKTSNFKKLVQAILRMYAPLL